jgi:hypothetical protein
MHLAEFTLADRAEDAELTEWEDVSQGSHRRHRFGVA